MPVMADTLVIWARSDLFPEELFSATEAPIGTSEDDLPAVP